MPARFSGRVGGSSGIPHGVTSFPQALKWKVKVWNMQMLLCYKYRMQRNRHRIMQIVRATHIFWVREILRRREEKGAYLVGELQLDPENHHQLAYFRMLINLLTATAQNEIKETIRGIGPRLILLYHAIWRSCYTAVWRSTAIYRVGLWRSCYTPWWWFCYTAVFELYVIIMLPRYRNRPY